MIITGKIIGYDIGKEDTIFHIRNENGMYYKCLADSDGYAGSIRQCCKNSNTIEITGEIEERVTPHRPHVIREFIVISYFKQLLHDPEDSQFFLTGAL